MSRYVHRSTDLKWATLFSIVPRIQIFLDFLLNFFSERTVDIENDDFDGMRKNANEARRAHPHQWILP